MPVHVTAPNIIAALLDDDTDVTGDTLAAKITAAGFTNVEVMVVGDDIVVNADGVPDPFPPDEDRAACADEDELAALIAAYRESTAPAYIDLQQRIAAAIEP